MFNEKKAQILVITLFVLSVLALTIMGLIVIIRRDVADVVRNQKYEQVYNIAENILLDYLQAYGNTDIELAEIQSDPDCVQAGSGADLRFVCSLLSSGFGVIDGEVQVTVRDAADIDEIELTKDEPLSIGLEGYDGEITLSWNDTAAIEVLLVYGRVSGTDLPDHRSVVDVYNQGDVISSPTPPIDPDTRKFNFNGGTNNVTFNISSAEGYDPVLDNTVSLIITPRMETEKLLLSVTSPGGLSPQVREFTSVALDPDDEESPVAKVRALVNLYPQLDGIWNYSLITQDSVN